MRLIDADTLIDEIKSQVNECCTDDSLHYQFTAFVAEMVIKLINRWPTAYDVEKVVEALISQSYSVTNDFAEEVRKEITTSKAVDIVRKGGVK